MGKRTRVIEALDGALLEYAAKYGVTDKARAAIALSSKIEADETRENAHQKE